jgi:hypothetical protein
MQVRGVLVRNGDTSTFVDELGGFQAFLLARQVLRLEFWVLFDEEEVICP